MFQGLLEFFAVEIRNILFIRMRYDMPRVHIIGRSTNL